MRGYCNTKWLLVVFALLAVPFSFAQTHQMEAGYPDTTNCHQLELRQEVSWTKKLPAGFDIGIEEELREVLYNPNEDPAAFFSKSYTTLNVGYKMLALQSPNTGYNGNNRFCTRAFNDIERPCRGEHCSSAMRRCPTGEIGNCRYVSILKMTLPQKITSRRGEHCSSAADAGAIRLKLQIVVIASAPPVIMEIISFALAHRFTSLRISTGGWPMAAPTGAGAKTTQSFRKWKCADYLRSI